MVYRSLRISGAAESRSAFSVVRWIAGWQHMPKGMMLKSDGFASDIYDPEKAFTLHQFCAERGIEYADAGVPVRLETFSAYGLAFRDRMVPELGRQACGQRGACDWRIPFATRGWRDISSPQGRAGGRDYSLRVCSREFGSLAGTIPFA